MTTVGEALSLVLQNEKDFGVEAVELFKATGRILAQEVAADRDLPPYNRVMMDGIAINAASYHAGARIFEVENVQAAGDSQKILIDPASCIEVMTGALLPGNTD